MSFRVKLSHYTQQRRLGEEERAHVTHCTGGWVGPRPGLDIEAKEKSFRLCRGLNLDHSVFQPVARHYTDWATRLTASEKLWLLYA
jgi:hypothetical protein